MQLVLYFGLRAAQLKAAMQGGKNTTVLEQMCYANLLASFGFMVPSLGSARHINIFRGVRCLIGT
jgi:hypothetical protein